MKLNTRVVMNQVLRGLGFSPEFLRHNKTFPSVVFTTVVLSSITVMQFLKVNDGRDGVARLTDRAYMSTEADCKATEGRQKSMLYTKTGDKGTSSLYNGERRKKTDQVFHALGEQDELCASIGVAREYCASADNKLDGMLIEIQSRLFDCGAAVATPTTTKSSEVKIKYTTLSSTYTAQLEQWIDELDAALPPLTTFVIPSGGLSSSHLHMSRVICRRAERAVLPLIENNQVDREVGRYLNRLSDFLFAAARTASMREGHPEIEWRKAKS